MATAMVTATATVMATVTGRTAAAVLLFFGVGYYSPPRPRPAPSRRRD